MQDFFETFQFFVLACLAFLGATRIIWLRERGVRVAVVDRHRTVAQMIEDLVMLVCLLTWVYEIIAWKMGLRFHFWAAKLPVDILGLRLAGAVLELAALLIYGLALRALGESWRLGIDRERPGPLMTGGIYGRMRHPIYVAFDLLFFGTFLVIQRFIFLCLAVIMAVLLHRMMIREEKFLSNLYGDAYRDYCRRVGRYF